MIDLSAAEISEAAEVVDEVDSGGFLSRNCLYSKVYLEKVG